MRAPRVGAAHRVQHVGRQPRGPTRRSSHVEHRPITQSDSPAELHAELQAHGTAPTATVMVHHNLPRTTTICTPIPETVPSLPSIVPDKLTTGQHPRCMSISIASARSSVYAHAYMDHKTKIPNTPSDPRHRSRRTSIHVKATDRSNTRMYMCGVHLAALSGHASFSNFQ